MIGAGWAIATEDGVAHVVPIGDVQLHYYTDCHCQPRQDECGVLVHTSFDGREAFETGERKPS